MRTPIIILIALTIFIPQACREGSANQVDETRYVCPPCGHNCMETTFERAGACGTCGMTLVTMAEAKATLAAQEAAGGPHASNEEQMNVAILVFDGVQIIDYTGPYEVFAGAGFNVYTVAKTRDAITTVYGMVVTPAYTFDEHPEPDIVLVPGGEVLPVQSDPTVQDWLRSNAENAGTVISVCNGAFILAKAGLLRGLKATTTRDLVSGLASAAPDIEAVHNQRWVDNGKIITTGGLSAGIDGALHVVSKIRGRAFAERLATGLEYRWQQEP